MHVLVIDDDPFLPRLYRNFLNQMGHEITLTRTCVAGITKLAMEPTEFGLVITDLRTPGQCNGFDVVRVAQNIFKPVIMVTTTPDLIPEDLKPFPILAKPFTREQFQTAIQQVTIAAGQR